MNKPNPSPTLLLMAGPLVVSFWMRAAVTFVDTIYAALLGDAAIAAIGLTVPFEFVMIALWVGLSTGLTSSISRAMGAREEAKLAQYVAASWRLVWMAAPVFLAIGIGIWLVAPRMGLAPDVANDFRIYGSVLVAGSAFSSFWSIIPDSLIKAHHDTRSTMWAGIWTNLINVALNTLFLFGFDWGIFGIALSTVLGRFGGLAYAIARARAHERARRQSAEDERRELDPQPYRQILRLAVPASMTFLLVAAETALINVMLAASENSKEAIAAYSIYYRVVLFTLQPIIAIAVVMLPYAARRFGEGDVPGVRRGVRDAGLATAIYSLVLVGPLMLAFAPALASSLAETEITARYSTFALRTVPLACLLGAPFLFCRPVFEAMNRGTPGLIMALVRYVGLTAPLAWFGMELARRMNYAALYGLLVGLLAAALLSSAAFYTWLHGALGRPGVGART